VSVEKRRKGGHTVYLARWREGTRQRARTFTRKADAEGFEGERRREAALGAHGLPQPPRGTPPGESVSRAPAPDGGRLAPRALSPTEVELVRASMPTLRDVGLLGLLAYAGLRPGEALALRWRDVGGVLVVDRAVSDWVIRQTKTNRRRTIEVVAPLAADLDLHRPKVAASDALVCAGGRGQVLDLDNWRSRVWVPACEAAGVRAAPYDGRDSMRRS
jgi:integrase